MRLGLVRALAPDGNSSSSSPTEESNNTTETQIIQPLALPSQCRPRFFRQQRIGKNRRSRWEGRFISHMKYTCPCVNPKTYITIKEVLHNDDNKLAVP